MCDIMALCHRFIGRQILIAQNKTPKATLLEKYQTKREQLGGVEFFATRDDHEQVPAVRFLGKNCTEKSPTIIVFNGSEPHFQSFVGGNGFEVSKWLDEGINVICFNYHGVDLRYEDNRGNATRQGLIADGRAIVEHAIRRFGVAEKDITIYGYSLGAGAGSEIALQFPATKICCDRTFKKLSDEVQALYGDGIIGKILASVVRLFGWEFDIEANWNRIAYARKWTVNNVQDDVIPARVRLATLLQGTEHEGRLITMQPTRDFHHARPIDDAARKKCIEFMRA